ncbi:hypothetical protein A0O36_01928 [Piscirickettsiaceae bacterium NZ-RLO1]|nr:hypothetical protein A0O36_01928 [Piscirickettsiaceae bacterium NZ-RLO1]
MPKIVWEKQANRTAEEQRAAEWRVIKKYLKNRPTGTELHPSHSRRINLIDDMTGDRVYLTHRYLKGQGNNDFFVKSNGQLLGKGAFGEVTFAETEDEVKLAIKEFKELSPESRNNDVAYDLNKARKIFSDGSKYYQVYQFLGTPGDKYIKEHPGDFDLAIKAARVTHYLHTAVYSKKIINMLI